MIGSESSGSTEVDYSGFFNSISSYSTPDNYVSNPSYYDDYYSYNTNTSSSGTANPVQNINGTEAMRMAEGEAGGGKNTYMAGAIVLSAVLVADDATVVLTVDDVAIPFIIVGAYVLDRVLNQILKGTHESIGTPFKEVRGFDNKNRFNNGPKTPFWLKAAVWTATGGGLYYQWHKTVNTKLKRPTKKDPLIIKSNRN